MNHRPVCALLVTATFVAGCPHATTDQSNPPGLSTPGEPASTLVPRLINEPEKLTEGRSLYQQSFKGISCAHCHGVNGDGCGIMTPYIEPRPPAFSNQALLEAFAQHSGRVFTWVSRGVQRTPMPAFGLVMSEQERFKVINYAWTLGLKDQGHSRRDCR